MRARVLLLALFAAACGPAVSERVSVLGVDRLSGEVSAQEVELPGTDLVAVRGPAGVVLEAGRSPECALRRKVNGAWVARTQRCVSLLGDYAALERARQFLLSAGAEALQPAAIMADDGNEPGLHYDPRLDAFTLGEGPAGARVPAALNPGGVARELTRRQLRSVPADVAEGVALFLGAAASADPGFLASSEPGGDPMGRLDLSRPLPAGAPASAVLAAALWAWADASGDLTNASRAALAAARAVGQGPSDPAAVLSLVAGQLDSTERDQACAIFRARLHTAAISACP